MKRQMKPFSVEIKGARRQKMRLKPDSLYSEFQTEEQPSPEPFVFREPEPQVRSDPSYEEALRAADAVFSRREEDTPDAAPDDGRRILVALNEADPLAERLAEAEARRRRGRPPKVVEDTTTQTQLVITHQPEPVQEPPEPDEVEKPLIAMRANAAIVAYQKTPRAIRDKWVTRTALAPGERWKRRLPKACW